MNKIKHSYGLICVTKEVNTRVLVVRRLSTYHFCDFVTGRYKSDDAEYLRKLFNGMSAREKNDIMSLRFETLWYQIYHENPALIRGTPAQNNNSTRWMSHYIRKKAKFEAAFMKDNGNYLRKLIYGTKSIEPPLEFPKGKPDSGESEIDTAMRETEEEASVPRDKLSILWHLAPYIETYRDCGTIYRNTYYFAEIDGWEPKNIYVARSGLEVAEVKLLSLAEIAQMYKLDNSNKKIYTLVTKATKKYKNYKRKQRFINCM